MKEYVPEISIKGTLDTLASIDTKTRFMTNYFIELIFYVRSI